MRQKLPILVYPDLVSGVFYIFIIEIAENQPVHVLRVQAVYNTVGQSDGRYNNSGSFYMSSYLEKYLCSRNNNIGPVRFQLILLNTLFGREGF